MKKKIDYTKTPQEIGKQMGEKVSKKLNLNLDLYEPQKVICPKPTKTICEIAWCPHGRPNVCPPDCMEAEIKAVHVPPDELLNTKEQEALQQFGLNSEPIPLSHVEFIAQKQLHKCH